MAHKLKIADTKLEIQKDGNSIYVPLLRQPSPEELKAFMEQAENAEISTHTFQQRPKRAKNLIEMLDGKLPPHLLSVLPRSADVVGDIAIIEIPPELEAHKVAVGKAVLNINKKVKTVLAKTSAVSGTYRLREYVIIAGDAKTITIHKEHGCKYYVDVAKIYFSPRLSYEHNRVASLVNEDETIIDLFAGVGPFSILIANTHENVMVYAVDVNPDAVEFLKKNIRLNSVENKVHPLLGDARQVVKEKLSRTADRVIMNLPEKAIEFIDVACEALKQTGGIVHFYGFVNASITLESMQSRFTKAIERCGRKVEEISTAKSVRATAPHEWQFVLDAKIC